MLAYNVVKLQMLTASSERFDAIQREAPVEHRGNLVQVTKYQAGKNCKVFELIKTFTLTNIH